MALESARDPTAGKTLTPCPYEEPLPAHSPEADPLTRAVAAWAHRRNRVHVTIDWQFTTADARIK